MLIRSLCKCFARAFDQFFEDKDDFRMKLTCRMLASSKNLVFAKIDTAIELPRGSLRS
jgi:hypothetical protein